MFPLWPRILSGYGRDLPEKATRGTDRVPVGSTPQAIEEPMATRASSRFVQTG